MSVEYNKPFLSIEAQIDLLLSRGLEISDEKKAAEWLRRLGYYRLAAYLFPLRKSFVSDQGELVIESDFLPGSTFTLATATYVFDKQLRILFLDAIERIEIAVRAEVSRQLGERSTFAHLDPNEFSPSFTKPRENSFSKHAVWLSRIDEELARSTDDFAIHFKRKYAGQMPIWVSSELWDLGKLANLVSGLKPNDKRVLASKFGVSNGVAFESWLHHINTVRNICAHHGRLWNRSISKSPSRSPIRFDLLPKPLQKDFDKNRVDTTAQIICNLLAVIQPSSSWPDRYLRLKTEFYTGVYSQYPWVTNY